MPTLEELFAQVDAQREEIIALEQDLVRIPSVNTGFMPTGDETPVCEYIRDWLAEDGIESEILGRTPERGNILARIEGSNSDAGLMFMSHTDVVPVEEEEKWRFPPFSATIADGRIYGRGASDCKGLLTAQLYAMRLLIRNGIQLEDSLIFCSGADEEHGGRYGFGWLAENHPDKIRAPFAVNEGGGTPIDSPSGLTYLLGTGEKGRLQVEIEVKGVSSHASVPGKERTPCTRCNASCSASRHTSRSATHPPAYSIIFQSSPSSTSPLPQTWTKSSPKSSLRTRASPP